MNMKKRLFVAIIAAAILVGAPVVFAQSPEKILKAAAKTLGGEKNIRAVVSWQERGKIRRLSDGASGAWQAQAKQPGYYNASYDLNGFEVAVGYSGKSGWMRDSQNGLRTLTGQAARDFQTEAAYRNTLWLDYKKDKAKVASGGTASVNGKPANVVLMTNARGTQIKMYFDQATKMLVREDIPAGKLIRSFEYSDHRAVNGVMQPFTILSTIEKEMYEIKLDQVSHNQNIAVAAFDFPKMSNEPLPDIKALLQEIRDNADKLDEILDNYSYTAISTAREIDKAGNLVEKGTETRSFTFYKGYRITRLIAKNGKPLSPSDQADENKKAEKQVREIEDKIADKEKKAAKQMRDVSSSSAGTPEEEGGGQRITLSEALKGSLLVNPRRERLKGRDVIVFDYEPNPQFKPEKRMEKLFALCTGVVWVDSQDKQIVRLDAFLTKSAGNLLAKVKRGASFSLENERVNNEIWLPSQADVNLSVKILFAGINVNQLVKYGDYKKFTTEVKDAKVDETKP